MKIKTLFWTILVVTGILVIQTLVMAKIHKDNRRLADNFAAVIGGTEYYRINDSISAARSERILLDNAEIKAHFPEIKSTIAQMDVKLRQLERYSAVNSTENYVITTKLQELQDVKELRVFPLNIHQPETSPASQLPHVQFTQYKDKGIDFRQAIVADSAYTSIQTRDSINIVQSWTRPRKFLFVQWGRKRHIQTVTNANPNASITYSIYIEKQ
jgi:hypothetical protein